jgi:hypothetical protein
MKKKRYKYTGTPEQLEEFGYEVTSDWASKEVAEDEDETIIELYIPFETIKDVWYFQAGMISFNCAGHDFKFDVKDYIQDLIEAGLVEVLG